MYNKVGAETFMYSYDLPHEDKHRKQIDRGSLSTREMILAAPKADFRGSHGRRDPQC